MALRPACLRLRTVTGRTGIRTFSSGKVLGEEERAAENMYIKKMEKEKLEKAARQGVKPEELSTKGANPLLGGSSEAPVDSTKNIAVAAGVVAIIAGGWWAFRANKKVKEEEKE